MPKNIVVCCDGTGNEIGRNLSNVVKLFRCLIKDDHQIAYYDPGVGTLGRRNAWQRSLDAIRRVWGQITGAGLDDNVLDAYRFLVETYEDGAHIYLFGFSRGAYTVRVVAALLHSVGLLRPEQLNLAGYALTAYKKTKIKETLDDDLAREIEKAIAEHGVRTDMTPSAAPSAAARKQRDREEYGRYFGRIAGARRVPVHFIGVWDTVASILVPRPFFFVPKLEALAYTGRNPSVRAFRQAAAIDEKRRMFRLNAWTDGQVFDPKESARTPPLQDQKQVWFAGYHSNVGGGFAEKESAIAKYPLDWLVGEATAAGLLIDGKMAAHLIRGESPSGGSSHYYSAPAPTGDIHNSMKPGWWPFEIFPKNVKWREWTKRPAIWRWYFPLAEPRTIPERAMVHWSAIERHEQDAKYRPINWPKNPAPATSAPWTLPPGAPAAAAPPAATPSVGPAASPRGTPPRRGGRSPKGSPPAAS